MLAPRGLASDLSPDRVSIQVDGARVRHQMGGGIGASWHAIEAPIPVVDNRSHGGSGWGGYPPANDEAAWRQIYHHADWLGLDFCRVELEQRIYEPERNRFTWDSSEMRILYRILDWCERRQADVFLQQMWGNVDWNAFPEFQGDPVKRVHSGPRSMEDFANGLAALANHLVNTKGYKCIKWICINNEPGYDWSWWQRPPNEPMPLRAGLAAVRHALDGYGVHTPLSGPDQTDLPAFEPGKIDFDEFIGAYDLHCYYARFDWMTGPGYTLREAEQRLRLWREWSSARGKPPPGIPPARPIGDYSGTRPRYANGAACPSANLPFSFPARILTFLRHCSAAAELRTSTPITNGISDAFRSLRTSRMNLASRSD